MFFIRQQLEEIEGKSLALYEMRSKGTKGRAKELGVDARIVDRKRYCTLAVRAVEEIEGILSLGTLLIFV